MEDGHAPQETASLQPKNSEFIDAESGAVVPGGDGAGAGRRGRRGQTRG